MNLWDELRSRDLFFQCTDDAACSRILREEKIAVYVGIDPTAASLHLGHLIPLIVMCHFAKYGHTPIVLVGGGTARVGDPSGKTESRPLLTSQILAHNISKVETQIKHIMARTDTEPIFVNNEDWLNNLRYIDFIRDIGSQFTVSRMLSFETYKNRLDTGLSFLEFNYQLLQSYDYLHLFDTHKCRLQIGGSDQWANIVSGTDLIRRLRKEECYGVTLPIITRSDGSKMGKTEKGAIYLDSDITSPYDFYQYLRNTPDKDILSFLKKYTFISIEELKKYEDYQGSELNTLKELLAYTLTEFIHGREMAEEVKAASTSLFYGDASHEHIPEYVLKSASILYVDLFLETSLVSSKSEARRLIQQGGAKINSAQITSVDDVFDIKNFNKSDIILSAGKKKHIKLLTE